ncbi:MAG: DUF2207 domain-containing protein [Saprospiraceae bacterium]|nr:DUF2207 domain-containing protein [Saprospiraceae bacterium]
MVIICITCNITWNFYGIWTKWGKDYSFSLQTEFYPPEGINPSIAGYLIDDKLDKKDLTALIPYWGQKGYLSLKETTHKERSIFSKKMDYTFSKVKELDSDASEAEKTIFNGIFEQGPQVNLSDLKERFYVYMKIADSDIRHQVDSSKYYYESSNIWKWLMLAISILLLTGGLLLTFISFGVMIPMLKWIGLGMALGAIAGFIIFQYMPKKTIVGTDIYKKLVGFKEFISKVEKDKLEFFLKQDPAYFDKVLPYAIVFNQADLWKKKFKDLEIDPPQWYVGSTPNVYYYSYLNDLDRGLNEMSSTFYSTLKLIIVQAVEVAGAAEEDLAVEAEASVEVDLAVGAVAAGNMNIPNQEVIHFMNLYLRYQSLFGYLPDE